jgi:glycosyltransferase involved in cell wall biosynthesis
VRILIFHGYLLGGTGSNVYNARLVEALARMGHDVHLLSQERHPEEHPYLDAAGDWDTGALLVHPLRHAEPPAGEARGGSVTLYRPDIGGLLPVYVADRYEGLRAVTFADCSEREVAAYIVANVAAVQEVAALARPQIALANHLIMGPAILARALAGRVPYAVKVHGSALEYTVKPHPERFLAPAREGVLGAQGILVGSMHTASSLWQALKEPQVQERTRLGPPGVDVARFAPRERQQAAAGVRALAERLQSAARPAPGTSPPSVETAQPAPGTSPPGAESARPHAEPPQPGGSAFERDVGAAGRALARLDPEQDRLVAFVGKLIVSKGIDLLIACWPLVLSEVPSARLVVVGFGAYREGVERLVALLAAGELEGAEQLARAGRSLEQETAEARPLRHLLAFLTGLEGSERERYLEQASRLGRQIVLTGRLDHEELAELLPACEALVAPSTFPEAFGMVAAEAAACGALPIGAAHSGLAEVSAVLARSIPEEASRWLSFEVDENAVRALAECLIGWLSAEQPLREQTRAGLVATVRERWSWEGVASGVIAAAQGELDGLSRP